MTLPAGAIDLGELPRGPEPEVGGAWPALSRLRRWHDRRRTSRLAGAVAATTLVLLTAAGGAGPDRPAFQLHLTLPGVTGAAHDQQHLYVIEAPRPERARLVSYRLSDGAVRWQVPLPGYDDAGPLVRQGVVLVGPRRPGANVTIALDAGSGQVRWRRQPGQWLEATAGGRFLFTADQPPDPDDPDQRPVLRVTAVDPATGREMWTVPLTGWSQAYGELDSTRMVVHGPDRELTSYDLATGEQLGRAAAPGSELTDVRMVGSLVLLSDVLAVPAGLTAYDLATLSPQWAVTGLTDEFVSSTRCGELLCLSGEQLPPRALDPATGELVWTADWLPVPDRGGGVSVTELVGAGLSGHLLLTGQPRQRSWLVDARTGRPVLDLQRWQLFQRWPEPGGSAGNRDPWLIRYGPASALVGQLRPDRSGIQPLGTIGVPVTAACDQTGSYLVCQSGPVIDDAPRELTVWRHRLP